MTVLQCHWGRLCSVHSMFRSLQRQSICRKADIYESTEFTQKMILKRLFIGGLGKHLSMIIIRPAGRQNSKYMYVFNHMYIYVCIHKYIHNISWMFVFIHTCIYTYVCTYIHGESFIPNTDMKTNTQFCLQTCMHANIPYIIYTEIHA